jgi:prolycopene isomerase
MAEVVTEHGGTVETRVAVRNILRDRGRVLGVRLEDGRTLMAKAVISTASPADTFEELLAAEGQTPAGYPPLRGFVASISAMQVHLLVNGPVEVPARSSIVHTTYDLDELYVDLQRQEPDFGGFVVTVLDRGDTDRAPAGKHLVSLFTLSPYSRYDNWNAPFDARRGPEYRSLDAYSALRERLGDALVEAAEEVIPDLAAKTEARKIASPLTMERYTLNTGGAAFGWANIPEQAGPSRPGPETPFRGLYMAGHWTAPGGCIAAVLQSGRMAARAATAE